MVRFSARAVQQEMCKGRTELFALRQMAERAVWPIGPKKETQKKTTASPVPFRSFLSPSHSLKIFVVLWKPQKSKQKTEKMVHPVLRHGSISPIVSLRPSLSPAVAAKPMLPSSGFVCVAGAFSAVAASFGVVRI